MIPTLSPRRSVSTLSGTIGAFESETLDVIQQTSPYSEHLILHAIAGMIVVSLVLMSVVKVDRIVQSTGKILTVGGSLYVQPLDKAIVSSILVRPGDLVKKGQVLANLDPTFALADFNQLRQKRASDQALVERLEAEQSGKPYLITDPGDPDQKLQASIWAQRQSEFRQSVGDFDARIASTQSLMTKAIQDQQADTQHLALASQMAEMQQNLAAKGWGSQALIISANDARVQAARQVAESHNGAIQSGHDLTALRAQRADFIGKWRDDLGTSLVQARNDLSEANQTFAKASKLHDLSKLIAPEDAVVLKIGSASTGSVVDPSSTQAPLFTLTPVNGPLEADVDIDAKDIGFIRKGDPVTIKFDAFRFTNHGTAKGVVESISDGSFTQSDDGQPKAPFFKVRVKITDVSLRNVPGDFRVIPGMTVEGDIRIGGRTMMSYLIEGGLRTGSEAMREP